MSLHQIKTTKLIIQKNLKTLLLSEGAPLMKTEHTQTPLNESSSETSSPPQAQNTSSVFSEQFVTCFEGIEPTITSEDAESSLRHLLEHRWDEFNLDDLGLDELREEILHDPSSRSGSMQLEYHPPSRSRPKIRLISGLCTVAAAAILFAYGPNLIESNIGEREAQFPTVSQDVKIQSHQTTHTPLAHQEGQKLTTSSQSPQITLTQLTPGQVGDHDSSHITYQLALSSSTGNEKVNVDLWRKQLNSQQQKGFKAQLTRASKLDEVTSLSESGTPVQVRHYWVTPDLSIAEYLVKDQHYQWSRQVKDSERGQDQVLMSLVKTHLKELAQ
jgi:hypothetical protein